MVLMSALTITAIMVVSMLVPIGIVVTLVSR